MGASQQYQIFKLGAKAPLSTSGSCSHRHFGYELDFTKANKNWAIEIKDSCDP